MLEWGKLQLTKKALEDERRLDYTANVLNAALKNVFVKETKLPAEIKGQIYMKRSKHLKRAHSW